MKFLIFNVIVFCSLGYLLTSKPNENFNEWLVNTKEKVSQISKEEVISKVQRATSKNKEENLVKTFKNDKQQEEKLNKINQNNNKKKFNPENNIVKENNLKLKKIIDQILAEKKVNKFKNENIKDLKKHDSSKLTDNKILKNYEEQKVNVSSKFMTHLQRESALADLIIDMELYHLNSFKN